jgi:hypothetical protein
MKAALYNKEKHLNWELLCTNMAAQVFGKTKITVSTQNAQHNVCSTGAWGSVVVKALRY